MVQIWSIKLTKPELRFCAGSNPACGVLEMRDDEDLWQWSRLEIRLNTFRWSTIPQKQFIIIIIIITSSSNFWCCHASLVKFIYWYKFHVNIMTGSGIMTIFVYKGLIRNPEIRNTLSWDLPNICRLGQVRNIKFGTNAFHKKSLNAAKWHSYSFYSCWVIKGNPTWVWVESHPHPD